MSISVSEVMHLENIDIIDIRSREKFNSGHMPGSKNIPSDELLLNYKKKLEFGKKYYVYCQRGIMSFRICNLLNSLGYKMINIKEGYEGWILIK